MTQTVKVEKQNEITVVKLNKPEAFNAFDLPTAQSLAESLVMAGADESVRGVVISGEGKAFCAGGDLKWMLGCGKTPPQALLELASYFHLGVLAVRRMRKPVIAAVNGVAAGAGFSLALACDFRVMDKSASFKQAYTSAGLCVDGAGTYTLPRLVGMARAMEIIAFDKPISSEQALAWGLTTKVVDDGKALDEALNMAHDLAKNSLNSFGWGKELITNSFDTSFETQMDKERFGISTCSASPDGQEGLKAFLEKRKPVFWRGYYPEP